MFRHPLSLHLSEAAGKPAAFLLSQATMHELIAAFDNAFSSWATTQARPSPDSIQRIEAHFSIRLPALLLELAQHSAAFGARFASLGDDFSSPDHIVRINSYWRGRRRTRRLPRNLVVVTHSSHDEFWCLDTDANDEPPVQFWHPDPILYFSEQRPVSRYPRFENFLRQDIYWHNYHAKQCP